MWATTHRHHYRPLEQKLSCLAKPSAVTASSTLLITVTDDDLTPIAQASSYPDHDPAQLDLFHTHTLSCLLLMLSSCSDNHTLKSSSFAEGYHCIPFILRVFCIHLQHRSYFFQFLYYSMSIPTSMSIQQGGMISHSDILERIVSIGFELESPDITPVNIAYEQGADGKLEMNLHFARDDKWVERDFNRSVDTALQTQQTVFDTLSQAGMNGELIGLMQPNNKEHPHTVVVDIDPMPFEGARRTFERTGEVPQIIYHTEFKVTYPEIERSNNVLLSHFLYTLQRVRDYIYNEDAVINRLDIYPDGSDIAIYQDPEWGLDKPYDTYLLRYGEGHHPDDFIYVVPSGGDYDPLNTVPWEPQCTIGVHITDLMDVLEYIVRGAESEVSACWVQAYHTTLEQLHVGPEDLSPLERNLIFLFGMYACKDILGLGKGVVGDGTDFRVSVRHTFGEIFRYHHAREPMAAPIIEYLEGNDPIFDHVTRIPYDGVVLLELRDFFLQFLQLTGCAPITHEVLAKGVPLQVMEDATIAYIRALEDAEVDDLAGVIAGMAVGEGEVSHSPEDPESIIAGMGDMRLG